MARQRGRQKRTARRTTEPGPPTRQASILPPQQLRYPAPTWRWAGESNQCRGVMSGLTGHFRTSIRRGCLLPSFAVSTMREGWTLNTNLQKSPRRAIVEKRGATERIATGREEAE